MNPNVDGASQAPTSSLPADRLALLRMFLGELLSANEQFNLTAVRDRDEAWERHIEESARLLPLLGDPQTLIDVGTGGGLPGMVLAICRPEVQVTLLDSTEKKMRFLESTATKLNLSNVKVECDRAETAAGLASPLRAAFDVVTARAVAPLPTLLELTIPFLKVGGTLIAIKGARLDEELAASKRALRFLAAEVSEVRATESGNVVFVRKKAETPAKYPRRPGEPKKTPL